MFLSFVASGKVEEESRRVYSGPHRDDSSMLFVIRNFQEHSELSPLATTSETESGEMFPHCTFNKKSFCPVIAVRVMTIPLLGVDVKEKLLTKSVNESIPLAWPAPGEYTYLSVVIVQAGIFPLLGTNFIVFVKGSSYIVADAKKCKPLKGSYFVSKGGILFQKGVSQLNEDFSIMMNLLKFK